MAIAKNFKKFPNEHEIAHRLRDEGYSRKYIAYDLGIDYRRLAEVLGRPDKHLSLEQMKRVAFMLKKELIEIIISILKLNGEKGQAMRSAWYEEQP